MIDGCGAGIGRGRNRGGVVKFDISYLGGCDDRPGISKTMLYVSFTEMGDAVGSQNGIRSNTDFRKD